MQWLASISVRRPVFASVLILALVMVGVVGYGSLGVDKFPRVDFPVVTITTLYPGAAPSSIETDITDKIEAAVNTVSGLETLSSVSTEGASLVIAQFDLSKNSAEASQDIQERVNGVLKDLPQNARQPEIKKADPDAAPVVVLAVKSKDPVREVSLIADTVLRRQIERIQDVGQVTLLGTQKRRVNVEVDPVRLVATGVSALEVQRALGVSNVSVPGGQIKLGAEQSTLRIEGRVVDPAKLGDIVVREQGDHPVRVRDVATVVDSEEDADTAAIHDGGATVVLAVRKQSGSNTIAVVDRIKEAMVDLKRSLPPGYRLELVRDNSEQIRTSVDQVLEHLILGSLLAAVVVLLFLGSLRSTFIAAISIPTSIISTFALINWFGFTLNLMTLLALALAVGIVIDDAIVVLENIYRFIDEKKIKPFPAAIQATKEIGLAVLATTLSLMAVFLPVAFMSGIVGRFLASFGLTMAFAIGVSLIVSFTLTPMMAARMLMPPPADGSERRRSIFERISDAVYRPIERAYVRGLSFSLRHRWVIMLACLGSCMSMAVVVPRVGGGFLPANDEAQFEIYVRADEGATLDATTVLAERIARNTRKVEGVTHTVVSVADGDQKQANIATIYVRLSDPDQRPISQDQIMQEVRKEVLVDLPPGARASAELVNDFSTGQKDAAVSYLVTGPDLEKLQEYSKHIIDGLRKIPGAVDVDTSLVDPVKETLLRPNLDRAASLGVDPGDITNTLALLIGGLQTSTFEDRGEQYDVFVRASERYRTDKSALALVTVPSRTLGRVALSEVVTSDTGLGSSQINRTARSRSVTFTCNVAPGYSESAVVADLAKLIADEHMPAGYKAEPFGRSKEMAKMGKAFGLAFFLMFLFMYLILAAQFESWVYPITIILTLPLTLPFAMISLLIFHQQLNIFSLLGLLVLFGVVKKNAILQVDQTNQLRRRGLPRTEAVLEANRERLRPILMTTFAFVAGMLPLVTSKGIGSGFSKAMAGIVIGGQVLSLLLTLLAIPVIYTLLDDATVFVKRIVRKLMGASPDRGQDEVMPPVPELSEEETRAAIGHH